MADEEHLKILKQGVEVWNRWREANPGIRPDLCGVHFGDANAAFSQARTLVNDEDLRWLDPAFLLNQGKAAVEELSRRAYIRRSAPNEADLTNVDFSGVGLTEGDLSEAGLGEEDLISERLRLIYNRHFSGGVDLRGVNLSRADLNGANFSGAKFGGADLSGANFRGADLAGADFTHADLSGANLIGADVSVASFSKADLSRALLGGARFIGANLIGADLIGADLRRAYLVRADLGDAVLSEAKLGFTVLANLDLSMVKGLEIITYQGPSTISIDTISRSGGKIPEAFLRGCGLSDWEIEMVKLYRPGISSEEFINISHKAHDLRIHQAIQINPLFISYSHSDGAFVDRIERYLDDKGIRFWRDVHHATAGRLEKVVDRAIRYNPTVLLILSEHSTESDWVEHEARVARKLEKELGRDVMCPVALDDSWKTCRWPERLREQIEEYNILDFSNWEDEAYFQRMFTRLIDGLDLFYKE